MTNGRLSFALVTLVASIAFAVDAQAAVISRVFHISIDGLRGDLLRDLVAANPATYPNFARLQNEGAFTYNARTDYFFTETIPNHTTIVTGRPVSQPTGLPNTVHHGYSNNFPGANDTYHANGNPNVPYKASTFDVVHDHGLSTAAYLSKTRLTILERSYNATNGAPDTTGPDNGRDKIDTQVITTTTAPLMTDLLNNSAAAPKHYTFIHLTDPDTAVHSSGAPSTAYNAAVAVTDGQIGQILNLITTNPNYAGVTALILTADHGGTPTRDHTNAALAENYTIPFFLWGPDIPAGVSLYDLAVNRYDPGTGRPTYTDALQPIRNGDSANLALDLLGLPAIPGSFMHMELAEPVIPEPMTAGLLFVAVTALRSGRIGRRWRTYPPR